MKKFDKISILIAIASFVAMCCPIGETLKWVLCSILYLIVGYWISYGLTFKLEDFNSATLKSRISFYIVFSIFWPILTIASFMVGLTRDIIKLIKKYGATHNNN
jgi:hypothetical protein